MIIAPHHISTTVAYPQKRFPNIGRVHLFFVAYQKSNIEFEEMVSREQQE